MNKATRRIINTPDGPLLVSESDGLLRARGIQYATAVRFKPSVPTPPSPAVRDATKPGPACPQLPSRLDEVMGNIVTGLDTSEDGCLVLSVTAPTDATNLPVMVWYHGGAYMSGSGESGKYDPTNLVSEGRVVVVNVSYRLGIFGYVTPEGPGLEQNLGLRDQVTALEWVSRNISAFGGAPGEITLFGQSAGGDSVLSLVLATGGRGLVKRALLQSAPIGLRAGRERMHSKVRAAVTQTLGADPGAAETGAVLIAQLAAVQAAHGFGPLSSMPLGNVLGQEPLAEHDLDPAQLARVAPAVELMIVHTKHDARPFVALDPRSHRLARLGLPGRQLQKVISKIATSRIFAQPAAELAAAWIEARGKSANYVFDWQPPQAPFGAAHCIELPFLFGNAAAWSDAGMLGHDPSVISHQIGLDMRAAWTSFAHGRGFPAANAVLKGL